MGKEVVENGATPNTETEKKEVATPLPPLQLLQSCLSILEKAVHMKDVRLITGRLLRQTAAVRQRLSKDIITTFANSALPDSAQLKGSIVASLSQAGGEMETDTAQEGPTHSITTCSLPEAEAYAVLLAITYLTDQKQYQEAAKLSTQAVERLDSLNRRTMDGLAARIYFYYAWTHECLDQLASIQSKLLALHQLAVLRHDEYCQETLLNLLIRSFLHYNLYEQAEQLRAKAQRPEVDRSSQQMVRHLFYHGRICAIQLNYSDAKDLLNQALRKAPTGAQGFRNTATKWLTLVRLLLGEVPAHQDLKGAGVERSLAPYFQLSQAVRLGDLNAFKQVAEQYEGVWTKDRTHNLVVRLRHNVIRAGLYRISLAYWRISLADVAAKLGLASVKDTEYIVAKAIRDGGIEAEIDHEHGWITSRATPNTYSTNEPQLAFHRRVAFCMDLHNEAVKAMRFEEAGNKKSTLDTADTARERAKMIEEDALAAEEDGDF